MLALFTAAFMAPVDTALLAKLRRAGEFWECGEKALAQIYLMRCACRRSVRRRRSGCFSPTG